MIARPACRTSVQPTILEAWPDPATLRSESCLSNLKAAADPIIKHCRHCAGEMI